MSEQAPTDVPVSEKSVNALFRYSEFVHVGEGADSCEHAEDGACENRTHFHAWVTLPNQFQQESLQQKARAARARCQRTLKDPESDAYLIMEADVAELRDGAEPPKIIEFLLANSEYQDRLTAMRELEESEEWEHRTEDIMRRREIEAMPEEDRPADEYEQLRREGERYVEALDAKIDEARLPRRRALEGLDKEQLLAQWREERSNVEAGNAFTLTYMRQQWLTCTFSTDDPSRPRRFNSVEELEHAAPEIVDALQAAFRSLDLNMQRQLSGNW